MILELYEGAPAPKIVLAEIIDVKPSKEVVQVGPSPHTHTGFGIEALGFRVWGFRFWVLEFKVLGLGGLGKPGERKLEGHRQQTDRRYRPRCISKGLLHAGFGVKALGLGVLDYGLGFRIRVPRSIVHHVISYTLFNP